MAMLVTAAHTHQSEANPSTVNHTSTTTANRLATPNDRIPPVAGGEECPAGRHHVEHADRGARRDPQHVGDVVRLDRGVDRPSHEGYPAARSSPRAPRRRTGSWPSGGAGPVQPLAQRPAPRRAARRRWRGRPRWRHHSATPTPFRPGPTTPTPRPTGERRRPRGGRPGGVRGGCVRVGPRRSRSRSRSTPVARSASAEKHMVGTPCHTSRTSGTPPFGPLARCCS